MRIEPDSKKADNWSAKIPIVEENSFLMTYPAYVIGRAALDGSSQELAMWMIGDVAAAMIFTEAIHAERMIDQERISGGVLVVPDRDHLAALLHCNQDTIKLVLVDPDPVTKQAIGFPMDQFLPDLEGSRRSELN